MGATLQEDKIIECSSSSSQDTNATPSGPVTESDASKALSLERAQRAAKRRRSDPVASEKTARAKVKLVLETPPPKSSVSPVPPHVQSSAMPDDVISQVLMVRSFVDQLLVPGAHNLPGIVSSSDACLDAAMLGFKVMQTSLVARKYCSSLQDVADQARKEAEESRALADSWKQRHADLDRNTAYVVSKLEGRDKEIAMLKAQVTDREVEVEKLKELYDEKVEECKDDEAFHVVKTTAKLMREYEKGENIHWNLDEAFNNYIRCGGSLDDFEESKEVWDDMSDSGDDVVTQREGKGEVEGEKSDGGKDAHAKDDAGVSGVCGTGDGVGGDEIGGVKSIGEGNGGSGGTQVTRKIKSKCNQDGNEITVMDKSSDNQELTNDSDSKTQTSLSNQETNPVSKIVNESPDMPQKPCPDSGTHDSRSTQELSSTTVLPEKELDGQNCSPTHHTPTAGSESLKISNTSQQTTESEPDQESFIVALRPDKGLDKLPLRRHTDSVAQSAHVDEGVSFSKLPEKPTGDGYNWRKYGQKLIKGNTFVRSYFKCTFANCPARKQVERSHDGNITEINYLWKHEHPKPPHTLVKGSAFVLPVQSEPSLTTAEASETETRRLVVVPLNENSVSIAVSQSNEYKSEVNNDMSSDSKRQKRENSIMNEDISTKTSCEPRVVVQTSVVDIVNDGYRWRKYGQKLVKGNPNPRSYYRCTTSGCLAKKHVERASHDEKVVITTYEGRHDHDMPAGGRTVTPNMSGTGGTGTTSVENDGSRPQQEAREASGMEMVLHVSAT